MVKKYQIARIHPHNIHMNQLHWVAWEYYEMLQRSQITQRMTKSGDKDGGSFGVALLRSC
jgi:hypothetical protein